MRPQPFPNSTVMRTSVRDLGSEVWASARATNIHPPGSCGDTKGKAQLSPLRGRVTSSFCGWGENRDASNISVAFTGHETHIE
jgi:hypothetical protein